MQHKLHYFCCKTIQKKPDFRFFAKWEEDHLVEVQAQVEVFRADQPLLLHARLLLLHMQLPLHLLQLNLEDLWEVCITFLFRLHFSDIASNIVGGMASGVGFSMANRAVDAVMGPRQVEMVHKTEESAPASVPVAQPISQAADSNVCQIQQEQLNQCLSQAGDMTHCSYYFDMLKQCQQGGRA